jgi:hypothetical protein
MFINGAKRKNNSLEVEYHCVLKTIVFQMQKSTVVSNFFDLWWYAKSFIYHLVVRG